MGTPFAEATRRQNLDKNRSPMTWPLTHLAGGALKKQHTASWDPGPERPDRKERASFPAEETSRLAEEKKHQQTLAARTFLSSSFSGSSPTLSLPLWHKHAFQGSGMFQKM